MITIRPEKEADSEATQRVNTLAFGRVDEAELVDALRKAADPLISLVAVEGNQVVGHILFTPVTIESGEAGAPALGARADGSLT